MSSIMTVSQLNRYIAFKLKEDRSLRGILISGEISNFTNHAKTGHLYFTLKDQDSAIKAVMFNSMASRLKFSPASGMKVIISANVQVYERDGAYQLYVNDMQPDGIGALYLAVEQLKQKLSEEGLFDESLKKSLPAFPQKIGIITSVDAAALQDILNILSRRYPIAEVKIYPCLVQGENAAASISTALSVADKGCNDILIVGRGGGSLEDLMAFNSELVVRSIFNCVTPVISSVGHETDTTLADYAADLRAPTPSAAAELAVPDMSVLMSYLNSADKNLNEKIKEKINKYYQLLDFSEKRLNSLLPCKKIENLKKILMEKESRLDAAMKNKISFKKMNLSERYAALDNLSPLKIMNRGYSIVYSNEKIINSVSQLERGDNVEIRLSDGVVSAVIE